MMALLLMSTLCAIAHSLSLVTAHSRRHAVRQLVAASTVTTAARWANAADAPETVLDRMEQAAVKLSRSAIESKLSKIPVCALVNPEDAPYLSGSRVGYFYLDPQEALLNLRVLRKTSPEARIKIVTLPEVYFPLVRGEQPDLGGDLRLRPSRREVVLANRALQFNVKEGTVIPTQLDEAKGQVPVFYSERVSFVSGGQTTFPFFFAKEDLDEAFAQAQGAPANGAAKQPLGGPPSAGGGGGGKSGGQQTASQAVESGIPIGLVRVATLDGLIGQMASGDVDLSDAVLVGSRSALKLVGQLVRDESSTAVPPA